MLSPCVLRRQRGGNVRAHISSHDRPGDDGRWCRTGLDSRRTVPQVGAEEHADPAVDADVAEVDMRLLDGALEIRVAELPVDLVSSLADSSP